MAFRGPTKTSKVPKKGSKGSKNASNGPKKASNGPKKASKRSRKTFVNLEYRLGLGEDKLLGWDRIINCILAVRMT